MEEVNAPNLDAVQTGKSTAHRPEVDELYGSWMLVKKPARRRPSRQNNRSGSQTAPSVGPNRATSNAVYSPSQEDPQRVRSLPDMENREPILKNSGPNGSRFRALEGFEQDMATTELENGPQSQLAEIGEQNLLPRSLPVNVS